MKRIIITLPLNKDERKAFQKAVNDRNSEFDLVFMDESLLTVKAASSANAIIGMAEPSILESADSLEWLQLAWAGADRYTEPGILSDKTILTNASGAYGISVAEHMLALTMALFSLLNTYRDQQREHIWKIKPGKRFLYGSSVAVLGTGDIGYNYARRMKAMGAYVIGISRTSKERNDVFDEHYTAEALGEAVKRADIIAVSLPGGSSTYHMISREILAVTKPGAVVINAGRGSVIDTAALKDALKSGILSGAGLDVFEEEPLTDPELWDMENVIITPHAAGKLENEFNRKQVTDICIENLYRYAHGQELLHIVDRSTGY